MKSFTDRTEIIIGKEGLRLINNAHIAVFGLGGVGGICAEALARAGVGELTLVDFDRADVTNINRQIFVTFDNIGEYKTDIAYSRLKSINPDIKLNLENRFFEEENQNEFSFKSYDYIIDCIDSVKSKTLLIVKAKELNIPIISAMGAGNKMNPLEFLVSDIYKTSVCPLAKVMRKRLKEQNIKSLKVVYSKELPVAKTEVPGSISFVPSVMGLILAREAVCDILNS